MSVRPWRDVYASRTRPGLALAHPLPPLLRDRRGHAGDRAGRRDTGLPRRARRPSSTSWCCAGGSLRAMQAHLDAYAAAAARRGARRRPGGRGRRRRRATGCSWRSGTAGPTTAAGSSPAARSSRASRELVGAGARVPRRSSALDDRAAGLRRRGGARRRRRRGSAGRLDPAGLVGPAPGGRLAAALEHAELRWVARRGARRPGLDRRRPPAPPRRPHPPRPP